MNHPLYDENPPALDMPGASMNSRLWLALCGVIAVADVVILAIYWQIGR